MSGSEKKAAIKQYEKEAGDAEPSQKGPSFLNGIAKLVCVVFAALYWYFAGWGYFSPESYLTTYLGLTFVLIFFYYPLKSDQAWGKIVDFSMIVLTILACTHYSLAYEDRFVERWGVADQSDIVFGIGMIVVSIEACRRVVGLHIPIICVALGLYSVLGNELPGAISHPGITPYDLVTWLYSSESIFGSITQVFAGYIFLFVVFGTLVQSTGGRHLFLELPLSLIGRMTGGSAKVSIVASALFGTISGSATGNVVSTGLLTIPLMIRNGFARHVSAAVEATASSVGIVMPPLMGAAIFIMADITQTPYWEIVKISVVPAIVFCLSIMFIVDGYARRHGISGVTTEYIGNPKEIIKKYGLFIFPILIIVFLMMAGRSPDNAVFWAIPSVIAVSLILQPRGLSISDWMGIIEKGVKASLTIGALAGCLGIIIGLVTKTGLATKLSYLVVDLSMGELLIGILLTAVATTVLGLGVSSVTADYFLLSILIAPALTQLGAPVLAAHLLIIWYTQTSNITPPVCVSTFAAAAIADADPWRSGWMAFRMGLFLYIVPVMFIYGDLLNVAEPILLAKSALLTLLSMFAFASTITGYMFGVLNKYERAIMLAPTALFLIPNIYFNIFGIIVMISVILFGILFRKDSRAQFRRAQ
ncbi:MAG: TRAP transporter fused permease subunit [Rhizobiaceae bacterium]